MGSDESHFNVSLIHNNCEGHSHKTQTTTFEEKGEPKRIRTNVLASAYQPNALPLGHVDHNKNVKNQVQESGEG